MQKAIDEFNRMKDAGKFGDNEVLVVLDPSAPADGRAVGNDEEQDEAEKPENAPEDSKAVLVTGNPPREPEADPQPEAQGEPSPETVENAQPPEVPSETEPEVCVESIRKGSGQIDQTKVKLKAGFAAKPLSSAPEGWVLEKSEQTPVFRKEVELQPGTKISLSIKPHVLAPASDGINTFSVAEPGFEASQGYLQKKTVSAILGTSVAQLDNDSLQLGNAISELHRLLSSLPKPEEPERP